MITLIHVPIKATSGTIDKKMIIQFGKEKNTRKLNAAAKALVIGGCNC